MISWAEHPFLITKASEFTALRARATSAPWSTMKTDAINRSNAGVNTTSATTLHAYIGATALAYILDDANKAVHAGRVRDAILVKLDSIAFAEGTDHAKVVPPLGCTFVAILALDIVYNDLTATERSSCEAKIQSKLDLISRTGSWREARYGTHGTWDIYKGIRTTPDTAYYNWLSTEFTSDGVTTIASNYCYARFGSSDDRPSKSGYMDVLEYTGIDNRYYAGQGFKKLYRWLFSFAINPAKEHNLIGDCSTTFGMGNSVLLWRVGNFDDTAAAYAAWYLKGQTPKGHILSYILMKKSFPAPLVPTSKVFMQGGAFFREPKDSASALSATLYNLPATALADYHTHEESNGITVSGYGNRLLVNGGWLGDTCWRADRNNTVTIGGARHSKKVGGGLTEGFVSDSFNYACGATGGALGNDTALRSLIMIHPQNSVPGYFVVFDEVDADAGEKVNTYFHPAAEAEASMVANKQEYRSIINHHAKVAGDSLTFFFATPPDSVGQTLVSSGDLVRAPEQGSHYRFNVTYSTDAVGDRRIVTILFPSNATHARAAMSRLSGTGYTGAKVDLGSGFIDNVYESAGAAEFTANTVRIRARLAMSRMGSTGLISYFVRKGRLFKDGANGFESSADVSLYMKGTSGAITGSGADVTFYLPNITSVKIDGQTASALSSATGSVVVRIATGIHTVTLVTGSTGTLAPRHIKADVFSGIDRCELFTTNGKLVTSADHVSQVPILGLPAGSYIVRLHSANGADKIHRIIITENNTVINR